MSMFVKEAHKRSSILKLFNSQAILGFQEENKDTVEQQKCHLTAKETIGAFGFGVLLCWIFLCYFSISFKGITDTGHTVDSGGFQLFGLGLLTLLMVIFLLGSDRFMGIDLRKFSFFPALLGIALPLAEMLSLYKIVIEVPLLYIVWGFNGIAAACAFLMWANYFCRLPRTLIVKSGSISALVAGFCYFAVILLPDNAQCIGVYVALIISIITIITFSGESSSLPFVSRKVSEENFGPDIRTSISMAIAGTVHGFLLYDILLTQTENSIVIIGGAFFVTALIVGIINNVKGSYALLLAPVFRMSSVPLVLGLVLLPFIEGIALIACEVLLLAILFGHWISLFINISFAIHKYEVQSFYLWIRGNTPIIIGLFLGWGLGFIVLFNLDFTSFFGIPAVLFFSLFFVVMITVSTATTPFGIDHLTVGEDFEYVEREGELKATRKAWFKACETVAKNSSLTPRETEVLVLLAKGRSSKVIERELSISVNTVKSHNYNIYKKVGVESQQELIDAIEAVRLKIRDID